ADQIISSQRPREFFVLWDCHEGLPGWERDVQKEADRVRNSTPAQLGSKRNQVIVVHPDHVIGAQHRLQQTGEAPVYVNESLEESSLELGEVEAIVKDGPQDRVGVAKIVTGVIDV